MLLGRRNHSSFHSCELRLIMFVAAMSLGEAASKAKAKPAPWAAEDEFDIGQSYPKQSRLSDTLEQDRLLAP